MSDDANNNNDLEGDDIWGEGAGGETKQAEESNEPSEPLEDDETRMMSISELRQRTHLINNDIRIMKSDIQRINHESRAQRDRIRENEEKVKVNKQLPYLVANVVEILGPDADDGAFLLYFVSGVHHCDVVCLMYATRTTPFLTDSHRH